MAGEQDPHQDPGDAENRWRRRSESINDGHEGSSSNMISRPGRPRFASNDKSRGTAEENQAMAQGTNSHFGRYVVDAEKSILTFQIEHASFPNWEGTVQNRSFVLKDGALRYTVRTTTT